MHTHRPLMETEEDDNESCEVTQNSLQFHQIQTIRTLDSKDQFLNQSTIIARKDTKMKLARHRMVRSVDKPCRHRLMVERTELQEYVVKFKLNKPFIIEQPMHVKTVPFWLGMHKQLLLDC